MTFRIPPAATEVEKWVLSAGFLDPDTQAMTLERLADTDFYLPCHQAIFRALQAVQASGGHVDMFTLQESLRASGRLAEAGGAEYLHEVSNFTMTWWGAEAHVATLQAYSARRRLIAAASTAMEAAYTLDKPLREVQDLAEAEILAAGDVKGRVADLKPMSKVILDAAAHWQDIANGTPGGLLSHFKPLDDLFLGFRPGKLYVLAARPGLGKSMLALQVAKQCGATVAHYSLEMLAKEQLERMISQVSELNSESLQSRNVLLAKSKELAEAITRIGKYPIWFADEPPITPANILTQCRRLKKKSGLGLIVADYLQLIKGVGKFERRDLEVGQVSAALKGISMKLELPVMAIASLSRKNEDRTDKRPILSDLRESGSIESDADGVIFLYREADYNPKARERFPNVTEIIVPKNRGGRTGRSLAQFDGAHSLFYPLEQSAAREYMELVGWRSAAEPQKANSRERPQRSHKDRQISAEDYRV